MNKKMLDLSKYIDKIEEKNFSKYDEFIKTDLLFNDLYNNEHPYKVYFRGAGQDSQKHENCYFILESHKKYYLLTVKRNYNYEKNIPEYLFNCKQFNKMYELLYDLENNVPAKLTHFVSCKNVREEINIAFMGTTFINGDKKMMGIFSNCFTVTDRTVNGDPLFFDKAEYTLHPDIIKQNKDFDEFVEDILSLDEKIEIKKEVREEKIRNFKEKVYDLIK